MCFLIFICSCSTPFEVEKRIAAIGTSQDVVSKRLADPMFKFKNADKELWLYKTGYLEFDKNKVSRSGAYEIEASKDLVVKPNDSFFQSLINFGYPEEVINNGERVFALRFSYWGLVTDGSKIISTFETPYSNKNFSLNLTINSFTDQSAKLAGKYIILPGQKNISPEDLQFKELTTLMEAKLKSQGYSIIKDLSKADYAILVNYGISDPKEDIEVKSRPIFIPTFTPGQNLGIYSGFNQIGSVRSQGQWGSAYGGQVTDTIKTVTYNRWLNIEAMDLNFYKLKKIQKPVWKVIVSSNGESGDMRNVLPGLIYGSGFYINKDSFKQVSLDVYGKDVNNLFCQLQIHQYSSQNFANK